MKNRALFVDRDGTLVWPRHYPSRPEELILFDGISAPLVQLQAAGFLLIVITNQSGLAHGYFDEVALEAMHAHLAAKLGKLAVRLDAVYYCPHHPEGHVGALAIDCDCRKPRPGLLKRAAADLDIDLARSWFVGDILHDVEAGNRAGCRTVLVDNGGETEWLHGPYRSPAYTVRCTVEAFRLIAGEEQLPEPDRALLEQVAPRIGVHR